MKIKGGKNKTKQNTKQKNNLNLFRIFISRMPFFDFFSLSLINYINIILSRVKFNQYLNWLLL